MKLLARWVGWVALHGWLTLSLIAILTAAGAYIAVTQFHINSNLSDLINQDASWRADFDEFEAQFPELVRTAVVVVKSDSIKQLELTTARVVEYLQARPQSFSAVAAPGSERFFREHALLYLDPEQLDDMADRLAEAQPWLTAVAVDPSLRSVLSLVEDGLENDPPAGFAKVLQLLADSLTNSLTKEGAKIWWTDELFASDEPQYQLIYVKAPSQFGVPLPDAELVRELRVMVREVLSATEHPADVQIRLTGELVLQHEEIEAAISGVTTAGWLALVLLFLVLIVGVRSGKIILATFAMLAIGIIWTSALAMLTVGEYNTLSLVFIVMFFGLGVDFALHFSLRYQEAVNAGDGAVQPALLASTESVGRAIVLCTATTAIGFMGFWPTDYQGLADLGVISAQGMLVACALTFTFLPACYAVMGLPRAHMMDLPTSDAIVQWLLGHRSRVLAGVTLLGVLAAVFAVQARFDYSTLALKDPQSESMQTLRELQAQGLTTDYQLVVLSNSPDQFAALSELASVADVETPLDALPQEQADKFYVIEDLNFMLGSALEPGTIQPAPDAADLQMQAQNLADLILNSIQDPHWAPDLSRELLRTFAQQLTRVADFSTGQLARWQANVVDNLVEELDWLRVAIATEEIALDALPDSVRSRLVSVDGRYLARILPAHDIAEVDALSEFITEVRGVAPNATGRPVIEWGVGGIVTSAFLQALMFAVVGIALVLWLALRRIANVMHILQPLLLTGLFTLAFGVVLGEPVNMANILVLPLIFGLGVDNGIHVVDRYLGEGDVDQLLHSSTPRAVLLSTMTTIGAFAALSFSPHAGTASIGLLLTIAVGLLLVFTIFLLPVLLSVSSARQ